MTSNVKIWVAMVAVAIIAFLGLFSPVGQNVVSTFSGITNYDSIGINDAGLDEDSYIQGDTDTELFYVDAGDDTVTANRFTQGGGHLNLASGAQTLTQAQLTDYSLISATASSTAAAFSWTLPATSTLTTLLPDAGDSRVWLFKNENAAATTTTFVAGTGIILDEPDGQNIVIAGGNRARIECWRDDSTDVICGIDEWIDAD